MTRLDEERARLLGVLDKGRGYGKFIFPIIRRKFPPPGTYRSPPIRQNLDYCSVGRPTFLVTELPDELKPQP